MITPSKIYQNTPFGKESSIYSGTGYVSPVRPLWAPTLVERKEIFLHLIPCGPTVQLSGFSMWDMGPCPQNMGLFQVPPLFKY